MGSEEAAKLASCGGDFDGAILVCCVMPSRVSMVGESAAREETSPRGTICDANSIGSSSSSFPRHRQLSCSPSPSARHCERKRGQRSPTDWSWTLSWALSCRRKPVSPRVVVLRGVHSWPLSPANDTRNRGQDGVPGFGSDNFTCTPKSGSDNFLPWHRSRRQG